MITFSALQSGQEKIAVVGLGYVGLPLAVVLSKYFSVIGLDVKEQRIDELKKGIDRTREVTKQELLKSNITFTSDPSQLENTRFIIIAVPTPVDKATMPDLTFLRTATEMVAKHLQKESVAVYESTVYPGVTEDICLPILEKISGLKAGSDFKIGYSPERINPGDRDHTITRVTKIVAGMDTESCELIAQVYGSITNIFKATSIKVAEAAKVIENTQRDINIALINELALIFQKMNMSVYDVLEAAETKWNFLKFTPGLVGGHCIGVDPYYLTYKAQMLGYHPEVILSGRRINDFMPHHIVDMIIEKIIFLKKDIQKSQFVQLGITFKENVPDVRNSKAAIICKDFMKRGLSVVVYDPLAYKDEVAVEYGIELSDRSALPRADVLIIGVDHDILKRELKDSFSSFLNPSALVIDIKRVLARRDIEHAGYHYWSL